MINKELAAKWAADKLQSDVLILDTETTGLTDAEIVQIAIINVNGTPLLDTLVKPRRPIPHGASRVHGIYDSDVADAPGWNIVAYKVHELIAGHTVLIYNAQYDIGVMHSANRHALVDINWDDVANYHCVMEAYAQFYGDWNDYYQSYRWQKLTDACYQKSIPDPDAPAHSALGDCLRTLALLRKMSSFGE